MFSIIVPLFNKAKSINNTIQSILDQSFTDFELIIVDDGSVDNSVQVVKQFTDKRIRLIQKENGGVCSARNEGISRAQFDYLALLDADDYWDKDYLLEQFKMINDFPQAMMWGINFSEVTDGNKLIRKLATGLPEGYRGYVENYFNIPNRISDLFCSSSVVIRKSVFDKVDTFDERIKYAEDLDVWYRIIANFPVAFNDKTMVYYRQDAENRALQKLIPLDSYLPYYVDKYDRYKHNFEFYNYIQRWSAVIIKQYYANKNTRNEAVKAATRLDYSVLPIKYKYIFCSPYYIGLSLYYLTEFLHTIKNKI